MAIKEGAKTKVAKIERLEARKFELEKEMLVLQAKMNLIDAQITKIGKE